MSSFRSIQVVNVRWFNATAWYGLELARLLNAAGHESRVVALADTETFAKAEEMGLRPLAMPLNAKNPLEFPGLIRDMGRLVRAFRPDVVNCHRGESFLFWGLLKGMGGYALVRTRGDQRLPKGNLPNRILHTRVADAVVATNSVMARHFAEKMRVPAERLHMILGGVDTERFRFVPEGRAEVRARYGFTDDECVVGLLGRFDLVKGQRETIAALAKLVGEGVRNIRLLLLGFSTATLQEEVEAWIREAGMERYVRLKSLGKNYTEEAIRGWILQPKLPKGQQAGKGNPAKRKKLHGLQALYYSYLYQMGVLKRKPKRIPYVVRQDIRRLDERIAQMEFLQKHGITTREELESYRKPLEQQVLALTKERHRQIGRAHV